MDNPIREHSLNLEELIYSEGKDLPLTLKRKLSCAVDDIVNFVSNVILEKHDYNIADEEWKRIYCAEYQHMIDEKMKKLIFEMFQIWRNYDKV